MADRRLVTLAVAAGLLSISANLSVAETPTDLGIVPVTPIEGPSWRNLLKLPYEQSAMGRMGLTSGPSGPERPPWGVSSTPERLDKPFVLNGADLYRLSCQSCHNVGGSGSPPEIRSLIDPVRATSAAITREQLKRRGAELSEAAIDEMARQARASLLDRLKNGGERMPGFRHLQPIEIEVLLSYLGELSGVAEPRAVQRMVNEPLLRVGEQVVKGNCYICHDAIGPGSDAMVSSPQLIPSLISFPEQKSVLAFVHKVREGAPAPGAIGRTGRMPVFSYLTEQEVAAAYIYLVACPPRGAPAPSKSSPPPSR